MNSNLKFCKNCVYLTKFKNCNFNQSHNVLHPVTGLPFNHSLKPEECRLSELFCGAEAKWFQELK